MTAFFCCTKGIMIGIVGAMDIEVRDLVKTLEDSHKYVISNIEFWQGKLKNKEVVIARSGIGKVSAAAATQAMLLKFNPSLIVNSGVAGGVARNININDIVIATASVQYDLDTTATGDPLGFISGINTVFLNCNPQKVKTLLEIAKKTIVGTEAKVHSGVIATGDSFISERKKGEDINKCFGTLACDMEGGSIGQVCTQSGVDFCILRVVSDSIYCGNSYVKYKNFLTSAATKSIKIITNFVETL